METVPSRPQGVLRGERLHGQPPHFIPPRRQDATAHMARCCDPLLVSASCDSFTKSPAPLSGTDVSLANYQLPCCPNHAVSYQNRSFGAKTIGRWYWTPSREQIFNLHR